MRVKTMLNKINGNLPVVGGGLFGGLSWINPFFFNLIHSQLFCTVVYAVIGSTIGWLIKRYLDRKFPLKSKD